MTTVGTALRAYGRSADFWSKAQSTQTEYRRVLDHLHYEIGATRLAHVDRAQIREWRDTWAMAGHRAATIRLQVLKNALAPSMSDGHLPGNLFLDLQRVNAPHEQPEQNIAWTDEEVEIVITHCLGANADGLARVIGLARYQGLRRSQICGLQADARIEVVLRGGHRQRRLKLRDHKSRETVDVREDPRLTQLFESTADIDGPLAYNKRCEAWKPRQLNQALDRVVTKLAKWGQVRPGLTLHGLRHARGVELAHAGLSDAAIMAQLGHADEQSARVYRRQAQRKSLADHGQRLVDQHRLRASRSTAPDRPAGTRESDGTDETAIGSDDRREMQRLDRQIRERLDALPFSKRARRGQRR